MKISLISIVIILIAGSVAFAQSFTKPGIIVLGISQDGGYPHAGCMKECCNYAWQHPEAQRFAASLALIDPVAGKWFLVEATPDMKEQLQLFRELTGGEYNYLPDAIFITHAHIGHYTGLMELGREVMNTSSVPVYVLPQMKSFLETNGPWSQLVKLENISVTEIYPGSEVAVSENISVRSFTVPHRDEYSETAGFNIDTPQKSYLFIPDIDKWGKWDVDIIKRVQLADVAFIDGTFLSADELPGRNMDEIPHPFIRETIDLFIDQTAETRSKINFIHLNHSNPLLRDTANTILTQTGMKVSVQGAYY